MAGTLDNLLARIRDGAASEAEIDTARALARHDARLPEELREVVFLSATEAPSDAAGLMSVLGIDDLFGDVLRDAVAFDLEALAADEEDEPIELEDEWVWGPVVADAVRASAGTVDVSDGVLARVERGVSTDFVYGPVLVEAVHHEAGRVDVTAGVLDALGAAVMPVAEAVRSEAGEVPSVEATGLLVLIGDAVRAEAGVVDVTASVASELGFEQTPVAAAVRSEAGVADVAPAVSALLGFDAVPIAAAVASEAGRADVSAGVLEALGIDAPPVAAAVRSEAGSVDVGVAFDAGVPVGEAVRSEAGEVDLWAGIEAAITPERAPAPLPVQMPDARAPSAPMPAPANRSWSWGAVLMAAIVLFVVGASQLLGGEAVGPVEPAPMQFAYASEIIVDELEWSDTVQVMQTEGDEGALIIWVDEEAT